MKTNYSEYTIQSHIYSKIKIINAYFITFLFVFYIVSSFLLSQTELISSNIFYLVSLISHIVFDVCFYCYLRDIYFMEDLDRCALEKIELIDGIEYQVLYIKKYGEVLEKRFFHNGLLSNHKDKAIQACVKNLCNNYNPYYYEGKSIKSNNSEDFIKTLKTIKSLNNFI